MYIKKQLVLTGVLFPDDISSSSLTALIRARQKSREQEVGNFFDALEEKYSKGSKKPKVTKKKNTVASGKSKNRRAGGK